jgi:hypothetical protein
MPTSSNDNRRAARAAEPVKEGGVGLFGKKTTCLTCDEVMSPSDQGSHVEKKHLLRIGGQFTYDCPCGHSAGRWDTLVGALPDRMGHMKKVHPTRSYGVWVLNGFKG